MPPHLLARLEKEFGCVPAQFHSLADIVTNADMVKRRPGRQRALAAEVVSLFDAVYVTRVQKERFDSKQAYEAAGNSYAITEELIKHALPDTLIMHPLPRVDELAYDVDRDPRAAYFRQASYGVPVRMALVSLLLGLRSSRVGRARKGEYRPKPRREVDFRKYADLRCPNARCVTNHESYLSPRFNFTEYAPRMVACAYCDHEVTAPKGMTSG
jgi:aspartate carbamoyltransferase catalytic subunit